jgi:hypothetical protein
MPRFRTKKLIALRLHRLRKRKPSYTARRRRGRFHSCAAEREKFESIEKKSLSFLKEKRDRRKCDHDRH